MFYTIYKITNQIDGKFYIGSHKTKDLNDTYMGSGKYLKRAQEKYGMENFRKNILHVYTTPEEMYDKEAEIVNEDFLVTENTYNLKIGGFGGWDYNNTIRTKEEWSKLGKLGRLSSPGSKGIPKSDAWIKKMAEVNKDNKYFLGKTHSVETKDKISAKQKLVNRTQEQNPMFGKKLKFVNKNGLVKRITVEQMDDFLLTGWKIGIK